jgi:hypothetical protein
VSSSDTGLLIARARPGGVRGKAGAGRRVRSSIAEGFLDDDLFRIIVNYTYKKNMSIINYYIKY